MDLKETGYYDVNSTYLGPDIDLWHDLETKTRKLTVLYEAWNFLTR
jgi:hypothetical protein